VVPLDDDRLKGKQITLALARLPAGDPGRRIGSLFLNPGGPGGSGVDLIPEAGPFLYADEVRARLDLVGFDPRGIARSTPLRCYETCKQRRRAGRPDPADAQEAAGGLSDHPATLSLTGGRLTTCLAS
jgi:pimeloyl-ACP methyl ester carboxylesterase